MKNKKEACLNLGLEEKCSGNTNFKVCFRKKHNFMNLNYYNRFGTKHLLI